MSVTAAARRSPRKGKGERLPTLDEKMKASLAGYNDDTVEVSSGSGPKAVMLAHKWTNPSEGETKKGTKGVAVDPTGWHMSEKLDGLRAYWDGDGRFYTRNGCRFYAPDWYTEAMPKIPLDGELWCGRGHFQEAVSICRKHQAGEGWRKVRYMVFDAPSVKGYFEKRIKVMKTTIEEANFSHLQAVPFVKCKGVEHLQESLESVEKKGGEGLMLREPGSKYERRRSKALLKVKTFFDEEALVTGSHKGTGKNWNVMGALLCVLPNGTKFQVGSGFTDAQRRRPPRTGSVITFKFQETTKDGVPRFPTFLRERTDVTWDDVKKQYKKKQEEGADPYAKGSARKTAPLDRRHSILWGKPMETETKKTAPKKTAPKRKRDRSAEIELEAEGTRRGEAKEEWACYRCTFCNPGANRHCGMCGWKRCFPPASVASTPPVVALHAS
uniref:RanBP2-type domain-containing protein n=1 Tax=Lotharella globosa TaxID=91324 RepID=A0A7S3Z9H8_9EUKA